MEPRNHCQVGVNPLLIITSSRNYSNNQGGHSTAFPQDTHTRV